MTGNFRKIENFPSEISIEIPEDAEGFLGRECPQPECKGYFKIRASTSKRAEESEFYCAYCGNSAPMDEFWTRAQIAYAESVIMRNFDQALRKDLESFEFEIKPKGVLGIGVSLKLEPGVPIPLRLYQEEQLETSVTCDSCGLEYSVFGVFAYCPDCASHNSMQTLRANVALVEKQLNLASSLPDRSLATHLIEDALENCVSAFDGFGRELTRRKASKATNQGRAKKMSFQNLDRANSDLASLFGVDLKSGLEGSEWSALHVGFMKRHLIAHRSGVIDEQYLRESGEQSSMLGRRVRVEASEVETVAGYVFKLGAYLNTSL